MDRMDLDKAYEPLPPINWPGGGEVEVRDVKFSQQRMAKRIGAGELDPWEYLPKLVASLVPSKSVEQIEDELDIDQMWVVVGYASKNAEVVKAYMEQQTKNAVAGTSPASPPPTPTGASSDESPAPTAVPCGAS